MRLFLCLASRSIYTAGLQWMCLLFLQACGISEYVTQADMTGSYLYVDELNMAAGAANQIHLACKRGNGKPLSGLAVQVGASKAGTDGSLLAPKWLELDEQGLQSFSFTLTEPGMYTLALQLKHPGSERIFAPGNAYTVVQVLDERAAGVALQSATGQAQMMKPVQAVTRGAALNTQVLLLNEDGVLQRQVRAIRFQSSDPLALLPEPILLTGDAGGNKIILQGTQLYTLGEQSLWAIEEGANRIVSEQRYLVTLGQKTVYRVLLEKPQVPTVADGQSVAQVQLTLTDGEGTPLKQMQVELAIGQGSGLSLLEGVTNLDGMVGFTWTESVAGEKALEVRLKVPSGMLPIYQDSILFAPGAPTRLRFVASPQLAVAGEVLSPVPMVEVVDGLGNLVPMDDVPVTLTLTARLPLGSDSNRLNEPLAGVTSLLLEAGKASFADVEVLLASDSMQLVASSPGLLPAQSAAFVIQPGAAAKLAFVSQPTSGLVYGASNPVQVVVQDSYGNLVPANGVSIGLALAGNITTHQLLDNALAVTTAGLAFLNAAVDRSGGGFAVVASGHDLLTATSDIFHVAPGHPDGLLTEIIPLSGGSIVADGKDAYLVEVRLSDGQGTSLAGLAVDILSPLGEILVSYPFGITTDNNGVIQLALRSTLAGEKLVLVQMGAINRQLNPRPIFLPGTAAQANLSLSQSALILDGVSSLTVMGKLEDMYGNPLANTAYVLQSSVFTDTILPNAGITDSQGRLSASWRGTLASARELHLQCGGFVSSPVRAIFRPGPPSSLYSTLTVSPTTTIADGQSTVVLQARIADAFDNPIPAMQVLFSASGKSNILSDALVETDVFGMAQAGLASLASQDKQIGIKVGSITLQAIATFLPTPCIGTPVLSLAQGTPSLSTGINPAGVVSADFNQDAIADLAVINAGDNTLGLLLGRADGTFASQVIYSTGDSPTALTTLDANHDGQVDLAVLNFFSNTLSIFFGRADGTFAAQAIYGTGINPVALTILDANRDGLVDLAVANYGSNTLGLFLGRTDGTFAAQVTYETDSYPKALTTLDANRDGLLDLAVVNNQSDTLGIFLGRADGTFATQVTYGTGEMPQALTTLDANRDGLLDLAVINGGGSSALELFLGRADGTFAAQVTYGTGDLPTALTTLDANRDGLVDLAVVYLYGNTLGLFLARADGTFAAEITYATGRYPIALTPLDANRDGLVDLAVANYASNTLGLFLGRADGIFADQVISATGSAPRALSTLDVNRDGLLDLAVINYGSDTLSLFLGRASGSFAAQVTYGTGRRPNALTTLDANHDGLLDLAVVNSGDNTLSLFLGRGDGTFASQVLYGTGNRPYDLSTLDANRDGLVDLAVVNRNSSTFSLFLGRADGAFATQVTYGTGSGPRALTTLDANRDGLMDLAVLNYGSGTLGLFLGRADGTFADQVTYGTGLGPGFLALLDINRDDIQDVFVSGSQSSLHLGLPAGGFSAALLYDKTGSSPIVVDFNKDYVPDIIMISGDGLEIIERLYCAP